MKYEDMLFTIPECGLLQSRHVYLFEGEVYECIIIEARKNYLLDNLKPGESKKIGSKYGCFDGRADSRHDRSLHPGEPGLCHGTDGAADRKAFRAHGPAGHKGGQAQDFGKREYSGNKSGSADCP